MKVHNGIAYEEINGLWSGYVKAVEQPTQITPHLNWNGAKIPLNIIRQAYTWFRDVYKSKGDECQLRLFYNQTQGMWDCDALPQRGRGLTTSEVHDHPDHSRILSNWIASGFEPCGTIHSHCDASAFQSGVDSADELQSAAGPHITIGKLGGKPEYHMRVCFRRAQYTADIGSWVDIGTCMLPDPTALPLVVNHMLSNIQPLDYPKHWTDRIIPEPKPVWAEWTKRDAEQVVPAVPFWLEERIGKLTHAQLKQLIAAIRDPYAYDETDMDQETADVVFDCERYGIDITDLDAIFEKQIKESVHGS